ALSRQMVNIADVYDDEALKKIHPNLSFLQEVDKRSGYRTKQMLVAPVMDGNTLYGVLQVINNRSDQPFAKLEEDGAQQLCKTLGIAIRQRMQKAQDSQRRKATKYDGLVAEGVLSQDELQQCIQKAREEVQSVEYLLMADHHIRPAQIGASLAKFFGVPYEGFNAGRIRSEMLHGLLKRHFIEQQGWMPLEETPDGLVIMCVDPEAVRGARVVPQVFPKISKFAYCVTTQTEFDETLSQLFGAGNEGGSIDQLLADMDSPLENDANDDSALESAAADNELVKFVNKVIIDAYKQKASDIHIEPMPGKAKTGIRFRIDGTLQPYIEVPAQFRQAMVTRLKIMCDLDISEKRKPQDGKIKFKKYGPLDIELRVATIPSAGGVEDVVMRILAAGEPIPLEKLGLTAHNKARLEKTVSKPYGLFYVCGPTGSGKTTTLHSILKFLNTPDRKIWTAEDPVEITQKGLRQVQINRKAGLDFATIMRAFLRADPDIIMVGESRDKETVSMGVEASLTGHMVFSTLHTNSAPESITRLLDMGMDPFNFADALLGILAQRLAKKLCDCKQAYQPSSQEVKDFIKEYSEELRNTDAWKTDPGGEAQKLLDDWMERYGKEGQLTLYRAVGCDKCNQTGYKGRIGLHELMIADDAAKKLIQERARVAELFASAVNSGMRTLKMDGMEKVLMGLTDLKMVRSVCIK
ncbi:MAG: Flp pilus assembly complex ATPase component TadA, partial [Burkholderiales bacterium]|nr:Flp pilus assembly complex ATPase component TadA [Burkholderiales bacterium]